MAGLELPRGRFFGRAGFRREVGVHFAATFRRFLGCSLGEHQRRRRFEHARTRLADRAATLAEIAAEASFADQSHLTRTFKRFSGMTPGEHRALLGLETRR
jgi:AraC family transcriptional regulator